MASRYPRLHRATWVSHGSSYEGWDAHVTKSSGPPPRRPRPRSWPLACSPSAGSPATGDALACSEPHNQCAIYRALTDQRYSPGDARYSASGSDIAIGMSGRLPDADDVDTFWRNRLRRAGRPAVMVQTFCSTSLVAVHLASESLRRG